MPQALIKTPSGETPIDIPPPGDFASFYVFAMHKSGSSLLNRLINQALRAAHVPQIAIPDVAFSAGLPENSILNPRDLVFDRGYCYRGFRFFPPYLHQFDIATKKKILLVRDPRDMLVSFYFSMAQSHVLPASGVARDSILNERVQANARDIDEYCVSQAENFQAEFQGYEPILGTEGRIYRYEDVIFEKVEWLRDMLAYLDITIDPAMVESIAKENDIRPDTERPGEHIRQVTPGNFRKHLSEPTVELLNDRFSDVFERYGYSS